MYMCAATVTPPPMLSSAQTFGTAANPPALGTRACVKCKRVSNRSTERFCTSCGGAIQTVTAPPAVGGRPTVVSRQPAGTVVGGAGACAACGSTANRPGNQFCIGCGGSLKAAVSAAPVVANKFGTTSSTGSNGSNRFGTASKPAPTPASPPAPTRQPPVPVCSARFLAHLREICVPNTILLDVCMCGDDISVMCICWLFASPIRW